MNNEAAKGVWRKCVSKMPWSGPRVGCGYVARAGATLNYTFQANSAAGPEHPSTTTQQYINSHDFVLNYEWGFSPPQPRKKKWKYFNFQRRIVFLPSTVCCFQHFTFLTWEALVSSENCEPSSSAPRLTKLLSNTRRIHKLFLFSSQTASDYSQSQSLPPWAHLAAVNNRDPSFW